MLPVLRNFGIFFFEINILLFKYLRIFTLTKYYCRVLRQMNCITL